MTFAQLGLNSPLLRAVEGLGYNNPTPIQAAAIPVALTGRDVLGCAQTGTGKTASFTLPILQRLESPARYLRALILAPTRELAEQICDNANAYGRNLQLRVGMVIGGDNMRRQESMLSRGLDILVATPGRLLDHVQHRTVDLSRIEVLVLDEADRMLDMGFINDIRKVVAKIPTKRQTLMFSATLPPPILKLANSLLTNPQRVDVAPPSSTPTKVTQVVHPVGVNGKRPLLLHLLASPQLEQVIVFTRTKWGANKLTDYLKDHGHKAAAIHGNKTQAQRRMALQGFRDNRLRVLVATDIAARGIDVQGVSHVVNFELPQTPEDYVHRIGRTGRAEATGTAISLMSEAERPLMRAIERLTGVAVKRQVVDNVPVPPTPEPRRGSRSEEEREARDAPQRRRNDAPRRGSFGDEAPRRQPRQADGNSAPKRRDDRPAAAARGKRDDSRGRPNTRPSRDAAPRGNFGRPAPAREPARESQPEARPARAAEGGFGTPRRRTGGSSWGPSRRASR